MPEGTSDYQQVRYETPCAKVARIVMNRPEKRNAQGVVMTFELDNAIRRACHDDDISVIILAAAGEHFNAGHDLSFTERFFPTPDESVGLWGQYGAKGWEGWYAREKEMYLEMTERWRNAPKPIIAEVQGSVIGGGNMLVWACDLIVCSEDARFRDNTCAEMGVPGVEFLAHPFELGVRKAKEWMFTGGWMSAHEAERRGMVNHVTTKQDLPAFTLKLAQDIAQTDRFALKLMKESINSAEDAMGRREAMKTSFAMHQIGHLHNMLVHGFLVDTTKLHPGIRDRIETMLAEQKALEAEHKR